MNFIDTQVPNTKAATGSDTPALRPEEEVLAAALWAHKPFQNNSAAPSLLTSATESLLELIAVPGLGGDYFADSLSEGSLGCAGARSTLRVCRAALDVLEAQSLREEAFRLSYLVREV